MTRRLAGEGSVHRRKDGRWQAVLSAGRHPDGRRRRLYFYGETAQEALDARDAARDASARGRARPGTLDAYLGTWISATLPARVAAGDLAQPTLDQYAEKMTRYVIGTELGRKRLRQLEPADIRDWLGWLSTRKTARGKPMTPGGVRLTYRILRAALNAAVEDEILPRSPAAAVKPPKDRKPFRGQPLTLEEAQRILDEPDRQSALWATFLYLGLRHGEALRLRWEHLDLDHGVIEVPGTKTDESRDSLPLPAPLVVALRAHLVEQRRDRLRATWWGDPGLVFPSTAGTPLNPSNVRRRWRHVCEEAGVEPRRIHDLRHTTATLLFSAGIPVESIARILRHASPTTTRNVYTHIFRDTQQGAVDALADLLRSTP